MKNYIVVIIGLIVFAGCTEEPAYQHSAEDLVVLEAVAVAWTKAFPETVCAYEPMSFTIVEDECPVFAPGGCADIYNSRIYIDGTVPNRDEVLVHESLHVLSDCEFGIADSYHENAQLWGLRRIEEYAVRRARGQVLD